MGRQKYFEQLELRCRRNLPKCDGSGDTTLLLIAAHTSEVTSQSVLRNFFQSRAQLLLQHYAFLP